MYVHVLTQENAIVTNATENNTFHFGTTFEADVTQVSYHLSSLFVGELSLSLSLSL